MKKQIEFNLTKQNKNHLNEKRKSPCEGNYPTVRKSSVDLQIEKSKKKQMILTHLSFVLVKLSRERTRERRERASLLYVLTRVDPWYTQDVMDF